MKIVATIFSVFILSTVAHAGWFKRHATASFPPETVARSQAVANGYVAVAPEQSGKVQSALVDSMGRQLMVCDGYEESQKVHVQATAATFAYNFQFSSSGYKVYRRVDGQPILKLTSGEGSTYERIEILVTTNRSATQVLKFEFIRERAHQQNQGTIVDPNYVTVWAPIADDICVLKN